jgi:hypothetical protein
VAHSSPQKTRRPPRNGVVVVIDMQSFPAGKAKMLVPRLY